MKDLTSMTTEELTDKMEMLMSRFEKCSDPATMILLSNTIETVEKVRDSKSW